MSRECAIAHIPGSYFIRCREPYLNLCDRDLYAAFILSWIEFRADGRYRCGEESETIWLALDAKTIKDELFGLCGDKTIRQAINLLVAKGFIRREKLHTLVRQGFIPGSGDRRIDSMVQDWFYRLEVGAVQHALNQLARQSHIAKMPPPFGKNAESESREFQNSENTESTDLAQSAKMPDANGKNAACETIELEEPLSAESTGMAQSAKMPDANGKNAACLNKELNTKKEELRERESLNAIAKKPRKKRARLIIQTRNSAKPRNLETPVERQKQGACSMAEPKITVADDRSAPPPAVEIEKLAQFDRSAYDWKRYQKAGDNGSDPRFLKFMILRTQAYSDRRVEHCGRKIGNVLEYALTRIRDDGATYYRDFEVEHGLVELPEPVTDPAISEEPTPEGKKKRQSKKPKEPKFSESFEKFWGARDKDPNGWYYWTLSVGRSPGGKVQAWSEWEKRFGDAEPDPSFLEGDLAYRQWKEEEFTQKGQAFEVPHGVRYIREDLPAIGLARLEVKPFTPALNSEAVTLHDWVDEMLQDGAFVAYIANFCLPKRTEYQNIAANEEAAKIWINRAKHQRKGMEELRIYHEGFQERMAGNSTIEDLPLSKQDMRFMNNRKNLVAALQARQPQQPQSQGAVNHA